MVRGEVDDEQRLDFDELEQHGELVQRGELEQHGVLEQRGELLVHDVLEQRGELLVHDAQPLHFVGVPRPMEVDVPFRACDGDREDLHANLRDSE